MDLIGNIIVGILAFIGAYLGTKRIKRHLIDNYIESRVTTSQKVNDSVLSKSRNIISSFEKTYTENKPISEDDLTHIISLLLKLSKSAEDGGKEVATISYLLYETVKDLKPNYEAKNKRSFEPLFIGDVVNLVSNSLRLIIYYCTNSAPIPFKTRLKKKSTIKKGLRKYLVDKKFYSLRHQPFGLTLNPNSEVILRYSAVISKTSPDIFSRNFYLFLRSNFPIAYKLLVTGIYMPLILDKKDYEENLFIDNYKLHLIKVKGIKSIGQESGDFVEFYYSNINPMLKFIENYNMNNFKSDFKSDVFLNKDFDINGNYIVDKKLNETLKIKVSLDVAKKNFKKNKWALRFKLVKCRLYN